MRRLGLRQRHALASSLGALIVAAILAGGAWFLTSNVMLGQRYDLALQQGQVMAFRVPGNLHPDQSITIQEPLDTQWWVHTPARTWSASQNAYREPPVPMAGEQQVSWIDVNGVRSIAVWTPVPDSDAVLLEITQTRELNAALTTLRRALLGCAIVAAIGGGLFGLASARQVLKPLQRIGAVATSIAAGEEHEPLDADADPDLTEFINAFNGMVKTMQDRIERDARFTADAAHELRSPLTTLVGCVELLERRRDRFDPSTQQALDLVESELGRFRTVLEDVLELGRCQNDPGADLEVVDLDRVLQAVLEGRDVPVLVDRPVQVVANRRMITRAFSNLVRNADIHGRGLKAVSVRAQGRRVLVAFDDAGPGVPPEERKLIFERFFRGGARRSKPGSGLGLAIVDQIVRNYGGTVSCTDSPQGGARFLVNLPAAGTASGIGARSSAALETGTS